MIILRNHFTLMLIYASATAGFFSLLWKQGRSERVRFFLQVLSALLGGGMILGWAMYPFPLR